MPSLILAPYNESMRLGQGYNSFLQTPCLENAVKLKLEAEDLSDHPEDQSQTVSYSTRCVEKISEVVRTMNVSAGSSIKNGTIDMSGGGAFSVDEVNFAESDVNVVVSVKVVNQTRQAQGECSFTKLNLPNMDSGKFHEIYGDCFISGFIDGGELHGIVSIRVLDSARRNVVISGVKGQLNGSSSKDSWTLGDGATLSKYMHETETNVTINWSGGGFIKPELEDWDFEGLMRAANSFSRRVAECPRKTWAILTRYDTLPSFVTWANESKEPILIKKYDRVQRYTADLLDMHMEHKSNVGRINDVISKPEKYQSASSPDAAPVTIEAMLLERTQIKEQMDLIVRDIEELNMNPSLASIKELRPRSAPPELWRARLPVLKSRFTDDFSSKWDVERARLGLPIEQDDLGIHPQSAKKSPTEEIKEKPDEVSKPLGTSTLPPIAPEIVLCDPEIIPNLNQVEKEFVSSAQNSITYNRFRFTEPFGNLLQGNYFNDAPDLLTAVQSDEYPSTIEVERTDKGLVHRVKLVYSSYKTCHPHEGVLFKPGQFPLQCQLQGGKIVQVRIDKHMRGIGISVLNGNETIKFASGGMSSKDVAIYNVPIGCKGLKGFWGRESLSLGRIGLIWG